MQPIGDTSQASSEGVTQPASVLSTSGVPAVSVAVLRRWEDQGLIPTGGRSTGLLQASTAFPPVVEEELPVVAVEIVEARRS